MKLAVEELRGAGWPEDIIREYVESDKNRSQKPIAGLNKVSKSFGAQKIITDMSFRIFPGEVFGIIGRSGAGKTTLINLLAGLDRPDTGRALIHAQVGLSTQEPSFYPELTVKENIRFFARLVGAQKKHAVQLVKDLELGRHMDTLAQNLSGGLQKKLDILIAFLASPKLVLLDEPTADLDPISRQAIWQFLKKRKDSGVALVIASHQLRELEPLCDRVAIINEGKLVALGTSDQFRERIGSRYIVRLEFESAEYSQFQDKHPGWMDSTGLIVTANTQEEVFGVLRDVLDSGESIVSASVEHPSLKHLFSTFVK